MNLFNNAMGPFFGLYTRMRCWLLGHRWGAWLPTNRPQLLRQCYLCCRLDRRDFGLRPEDVGKEAR